eukprot:3987285-Prymnesium_polylepis.2
MRPRGSPGVPGALDAPGAGAASDQSSRSTPGLRLAPAAAGCAGGGAAGAGAGVGAGGGLVASAAFGGGGGGGASEGVVAAAADATGGVNFCVLPEAELARVLGGM